MCHLFFFRHLFWTDWGSTPRIERSTLCGHNRTAIVTTRLEWPNDIGVDHTTGRIYWVDAHHDLVESVNADGSDRRSYKMSYKDLQGQGPHPYSMTFSTLLNATYWTDWLINAIYAHSPDNFGSRSQLIYNKKQQYSYKSIGQLRMLEDTKHMGVSKPCLGQANKCSHLCLRESEHDHMCVCPTGYMLAAPSMTQCKRAPRSYEIYFADSHAQSVNHVIKYAGQDGFTIQPVPMPSNDHVEYPVALDYDPYTGFLYWNDHRTLKTYRMHENGSDFTVVMKDTIKASSGIAVHKISKLLFFFAMVDKKMSLVVTCTTGRNRRTLVTGKFTNPRDIALAEDDGLIFFTDKKCLGRVNMDGTGLTCFRGTKSGVNPIGVAVDPVEKRVYWCDSEFYSIRSIDFNLDPKSVLLVIQQTYYYRFRFWLLINLGYVISPHSIAVLGEKIFWTDMKKKAIFSADKRGGSNIEYVTAGLEKPRDLHVYSDKATVQYRKVYTFTYLQDSRRGAAYCFLTSTCATRQPVRLKDPAPCPRGYRQTRLETVCGNCSDAMGTNHKCYCTNPLTCAQRAYSTVIGCRPSEPYMKFRVRECIQTVRPGVCSYNLLLGNASACVGSSTDVCFSDDDCSGDMKCCETSCGKRCSAPLQREDDPCSVNNGGCSHHCIKKPNSYQCLCPDNMIIDVDGKTCIDNSTITPPPPAKRHLCMLPKHVGSCHPTNPATRFYHDPVTRKCEEFAWGGCAKNLNNFPTLELCKQVCDKAMDCHELPKAGMCQGSFVRWYFHPASGGCKKFQWGGCTPGTNNFVSEDECMRQCHPTSSCDEECYNGGSCSVLEDGYTTQCRCLAPWYGVSCERSAARGMVTVTFNRISRMQFSEAELKQEIAEMLNGYCTKYPKRCRFVPPARAKRTRRESPSGAFTEANILIQDIVRNDQEVKVTFAVIQPASQQQHPGVLSTESLIDTLHWNEGRKELASKFGLSAAKYAVSSSSKGGKKKKSATPAIVLTILVAALLVCITGYIYYRKKEMSRRAASVVSPRSVTVEERASNMLERTYNNCSTFVSNTIQKIRLRDRLPNVARDSNVTHTAFENELYDDIMNPVPQSRVWNQDTNNNSNHANYSRNSNTNNNSSPDEGPIQTLSNPAYATTSPYDNISSPVKNNPTGAPSNPSKPPITDWVQFTDDEPVMGPGFADAARLDLQFGDPYNIDPGSAATPAQLPTAAPIYANTGGTMAAAGGTETVAGQSGYVELPRYNEPSPQGLSLNASAQQVQYATVPEQQYATIPADSSHTLNS